MRGGHGRSEETCERIFPEDSQAACKEIQWSVGKRNNRKYHTWAGGEIVGPCEPPNSGRDHIPRPIS